MKKSIFYIFSLLLLVVSCKPETNKEVSVDSKKELSKDDIIAIQSLGKTYSESVNKRDWSKLNSIYSSDAIRMPPVAEEQIQSGREAIFSHHSKKIDKRPDDFKYEYSTQEIKGSMNLAYEIGNWKVSYTNPINNKRVVSSGGCMTIFTKKDKIWEISREMWTDLGKPDYAMSLQQAFAAK
jgi:ketosteroid isomerase-like protein